MSLTPTLAMQCPHCQIVLEIDEGFAGSVCRCSHCHTLMSIPASEENAASAIRSPRPNDPHYFTTVADIPSAVLAEQRAAAGRAVVAYLPATSRKKQYAIIGSLMMTLALVGLVITWSREPALPASHLRSTAPVDATSSASPSRATSLEQTKQVHFMGVPLEPHGLVMIQATEASRAWNLPLRNVVRQIADKVPSVTFFVWSGQGVIRWHPNQKVIVGGSLEPADALGRIVARNPTQVVLVGATVLSPDQIRAIDQVLDPQTRLDVIWSHAETGNLGEITRVRGGRYLVQTWPEASGLDVKAK